MQFSIITPSFRNSDWLKLCVASVADQGVEVEHIVQDCCSDDGTQDWLPGLPRVKAVVEKDDGMYDAINRGLRGADGEILACLNCDEQLLPGALAAVRDYLQRHPEVEVAFGDTVFVDANGCYLCHRWASVPGKYHTWVSDSMSVTSCATFFRRSVIEKRGLRFDARLKDLGDVAWVLQLIEHEVPMGVLGRFTSVFSDTGRNMGLNPNVQRERTALVATAPAWARLARPAIIFGCRLQRLLTGRHSRKPFDYSLYTMRSPNARETIRVLKPNLTFLRGDPQRG